MAHAKNRQMTAAVVLKVNLSLVFIASRASTPVLRPLHVFSRSPRLQVRRSGIKRRRRRLIKSTLAPILVENNYNCDRIAQGPSYTFPHHGSAV